MVRHVAKEIFPLPASGLIQTELMSRTPNAANLSPVRLDVNGLWLQRWQTGGVAWQKSQNK